MNGTSPPVYSYFPQCVKCSTSNWAKYLTVSLLPTTVFFLGAVALRLRATAPHMNGFILFCQILTSPPILREIGDDYYKHHQYTHSYIGIASDIYISYLSIWNLDFFRLVYTPFCLHPNASTLQVLFLGAVALRLRATAPHMNGFILFCQILTSPPILREIGDDYYKHHQYTHSYIGIASDIYISYLSIWNLDFFRLVYTPFCLHPNASTLQVLSLDYIIAAYPLALIILTYTLVTLHYHDFRLVVCLWRPFLKCCIHFRRQWNIQSSLVDTFATFLLLSYVKFLSVSFDILAPTFMYNKWDRHVGTVLYYDGSVEYFGRDHLPYAVLAITVLLVFTILPILLLCLYPCHWFQKFLNSCHLRRQDAC